MSRKIIITGLLLAGLGGLIYYVLTANPREIFEQAIKKQQPVEFLSLEEKAEKYPRAVELSGISGFINTDGEPVKLEDYLGKKIVLIEFWTYSCINCQRVIPYLNSWYDKYSDKGLEIIGIHTPEFKFESVYDNVLAAVGRYNVEYPVVLDNDYSTWRSYGNQYWPRKYIMDIDGFIVYDHIGEGAYGETEETIQRLLAERAERLGMKEKIDGELVSNPEGASTTDHSRVGSPETYFGASRNEYFANGQKQAVGVQNLSLPETIQPNSLYLVGSWDIQPEFSESQGKDAGIVYYYKAKDVYLVASAEEPVDIQIFQDGELYREITVEEDMLYRLIEDDDYGEHILEILIKDPGLKAFAFTFG